MKIAGSEYEEFGGEIVKEVSSGHISLVLAKEDVKADASVVLQETSPGTKALVLAAQQANMRRGVKYTRLFTMPEGDTNLCNYLAKGWKPATRDDVLNVLARANAAAKERGNELPYPEAPVAGEESAADATNTTAAPVGG